jgi:hypothetical protein
VAVASAFCAVMGLLRGWQDEREFWDPLRLKERSMTQFQFQSGAEVIDVSASVEASIPVWPTKSPVAGVSAPDRVEREPQ